MPSAPVDPIEQRGNPQGTAVRAAAAIAILVSGLVHLQLYFDGYRDFPNANLGRSFLANAVVSVVLAVAVALRRDVLVRLAGAGLLVATLIAFWLSRTDTGIFGFTERGLEPSPQAAIALVAEIAGLVLLAATFVPAIGAGENVRAAAIAVPVAAAALIVAIGGGALWARSPERTSSSDSASSTPPTNRPPTSTTSPAGTTAPPTTDPRPTTDPAPTTASRPAGTAGSAPASTTVAPTTTAAPTTTQPATTPPPGPNTVVITIVDFSFEPDTAEVPVGTTVEWVNEDSFSHTVVADDGSFVSEDVGSGDRFTFQFTEPGTYTYICGIHPSMTGTIVVTG